MKVDEKLMQTLAEARPRRLDPDPGRRPDPAAIMAHPQPTGALRPVRRPARRLVLAGLVPAMAVVAAGAVLLSNETSTPKGGPATAEATESTAATPQSARELLLVAADRSASSTATSGRYLVITLEHGESRPVGPTDRPYHIMRRSSTERWYPTTPGGTVTEIHQLLGAEPVTAEDVAAWRADGSPTQWVEPPPKDLPGAEAVVIASTPSPRSYVQIPAKEALSAGGWFSAAELAALPAEPATLRRWLQDEYTAYSGQQLSDFELFRTGMGIVLNLTLSPEVRATAFRMLADIDGVTTIGLVKDQQGRTGVAVGYARKGDGGNWSQPRLIIDPQTGQPLAEESWVLGSGKAPAAAGKLLSYTLVTSTRYTDEAPATADATPRR